MVAVYLNGTLLYKITPVDVDDMNKLGGSEVSWKVVKLVNLNELAKEASLKTEGRDQNCDTNRKKDSNRTKR